MKQFEAFSGAPVSSTTDVVHPRMNWCNYITDNLTW